MDRESAAEDRGVLVGLGVPRDAEAVWRVLIANPQSEPGEVARLSGLCGARVTRCLETLTDARLVRGAPTPTGFVAIEPTLAVEAHIARAERELAARAAELAVMRAKLPELSSDYERGRATTRIEPGFEVVESVDDIRRQVSLAASLVRTDIRSLEHGTPHMDLTYAREDEIGLLERGVRDRLIVATEALQQAAIYEVYKDWHEYGHRARTLPEVSTRVIIFDRDLAVLPVDPTNMALGAIFIRVRSVIDLLNLMFEHMWAVATPLFGQPEVATAPTGRAARILELVALGNTDERISRTLGVGVRTIRREISELKTLLGVSSRAEISAAAIRKGWL